MYNEEDDNRTYKVVINHEEQYSIWIADRENALGWKDLGKVGTKKECLDCIDEGPVYAPVESAHAHGAVCEEERSGSGKCQVG